MGGFEDLLCLVPRGKFKYTKLQEGFPYGSAVDVEANVWDVSFPGMLWCGRVCRRRGCSARKEQGTRGAFLEGGRHLPVRAKGKVLARDGKQVGSIW